MAKELTVPETKEKWSERHAGWFALGGLVMLVVSYRRLTDGFGAVAFWDAFPIIAGSIFIDRWARK